MACSMGNVAQCHDKKLEGAMHQGLGHGWDGVAAKGNSVLASGFLDGL